MGGERKVLPAFGLHRQPEGEKAWKLLFFGKGYAPVFCPTARIKKRFGITSP